MHHRFHVLPMPGAVCVAARTAGRPSLQPGAVALTTTRTRLQQPGPARPIRQQQQQHCQQQGSSRHVITAAPGTDGCVQQVSAGCSCCELGHTLAVCAGAGAPGHRQDECHHGHTVCTAGLQRTRPRWVACSGDISHCGVEGAADAVSLTAAPNTCTGLLMT